MNSRLIIGNKVIKLKEVISTNDYLKELINNSDKQIEGLVVFAENQTGGRGQRGKVWFSNPNENLTFSILIKPNIEARNQFVISKIISIAILEFLTHLGLKNISIKWPNDIYCGDKKISGILIENLIKKNQITHSIIGIGLNVNQLTFSEDLPNPTSVSNETNGQSYNIDELFLNLLNFIDGKYLQFKAGNNETIDKNYLSNIYGLNQLNKFKVSDKEVIGKIIGVNANGELMMDIEGNVKEYNLTELQFILDEF